MTLNSAFQRYNPFLLFFCVPILTCTTRDYDLYTNLSNDFESNKVGKYNVTTTCEASKDSHNCSVNVLDIVNVNPAEVVIDTTVELQVFIANYTGTNSTPIYCFLINPDDDLEVLWSYWISDTHINCTGFDPLVSGLFSVTADFSKVYMNFDKKVTVKVISKHPVAEGAEYSYNFSKIFIHFDANIELQSNCTSVFSKKTEEYFGAGFRCLVSGSDLVVNMGVNFKLTTLVEIKAENKICRSGSGKEFCMSAKPGSVKVITPKTLGPILSLMTTSECTGNTSQKYVSLKVSLNNQKQNTDEVTPLHHLGKNQRKNLIIWRALRRIQNKLSSNLMFKMDKLDIKPLYESLASAENFLENETGHLGSLQSGVTVSVYVQSFPTIGTILAEANVTFCENFNHLFHYKWIVNEEAVPEDDKLLILQDVTPGKYVVKCNIIAYNSSVILGQGWTTTEIFDSRPRVIIYPVEIVTTTMEDIYLHVVVWHGEKISWACSTKMGKVCITNSKQLISDVVDMNASNISIPAGTLPAGDYIWTVENAQGVNTAKMIVKLENVITINVKVSSVFIEQSQKIILKGLVKGLQNECRFWWSSIRQKGFNYLNLQKVRSDAKVLIGDGEIQRNIDLVFPPSQENWKDLKPGSLYMLKLQVFCPYSMSFGYVKIPISVNSPPRVSPIKVEPAKGLAMATNFIISKVQADDSVEDYPLLFEWSYLDTCGVEIPIARGAYSRQVTTFLPPGDIKMILRVCDVKRACAKVSSSTIYVNHSKIIPENFHNAANQISYLIVGPDYLEAFGLATTVFKSLALKAEAEIRHEVFRSVEEGIYMKLKQFNESLEATSRGLDFIERALNITRYFPKFSGINQFLRNFKKGERN